MPAHLLLLFCIIIIFFKVGAQRRLELEKRDCEQRLSVEVAERTKAEKEVGRWRGRGEEAEAGCIELRKLLVQEQERGGVLEREGFSETKQLMECVEGLRRRCEESEECAEDLRELQEQHEAKVLLIKSRFFL
jgi:hypothetical protein